MKGASDIQRLPASLSNLAFVTGSLVVALAFAVAAQPASIQPFDELLGRLITGIHGSASSVIDLTTLLGDRLLIWPITMGAVLIVALPLPQPCGRARSERGLCTSCRGGGQVPDRPPSPRNGRVSRVFSKWSRDGSRGMVGLVPAVTFVLTHSSTLRRITLGTSVVIVTAVAMSRVSLGAHWATDVVAGMLLGVVVTATAYRIVMSSGGTDCSCRVHGTTVPAAGV